MNFITLTDLKGRKLSVNIDHLCAIEEKDEFTRVSTLDRSYYIVTEGHWEVRHKIDTLKKELKDKSND